MSTTILLQSATTTTQARPARALRLRRPDVHIYRPGMMKLGRDLTVRSSPITTPTPEFELEIEIIPVKPKEAAIVTTTVPQPTVPLTAFDLLWKMVEPWLQMDWIELCTDDYFCCPDLDQFNKTTVPPQLEKRIPAKQYLQEDPGFVKISSQGFRGFADLSNNSFTKIVTPTFESDFFTAKTSTFPPALYKSGFAKYFPAIPVRNSSNFTTLISCAGFAK